MRFAGDLLSSLHVLTMHDERPEPSAPQPPVQADHYFESGLLVYTAAFHIKRGFCCGSGCRHCPFLPRHEAGGTTVG